jgi:pimeloyl-ACP methyl ester carboxylesterase
MATLPTPEPKRLVLAGMQADSYGLDDHRAPLVLLHGLTFDRRTWQPVLDELFRVDPGRRVLVLDLPGHGESPSQLPHTTEHILALVHSAVGEAGLEAPVLVGHSMSGGFVTVYGAMFPSRGAVNVDALPTDLEMFVRGLKQLEPRIRGAEFSAAWAELEAGFQLHMLPADMRGVVESTCAPRQEIAISYWSELLEQPAGAVPQMLAEVGAALAAKGLPYVLVAGSAPSPALAQFFAASGLAARIEAWDGTGHFPHLARVKDFAALLSETSSWPSAPRAS